MVRHLRYCPATWDCGECSNSKCQVRRMTESRRHGMDHRQTAAGNRRNETWTHGTEHGSARLSRRRGCCLLFSLVHPSCHRLSLALRSGGKTDESAERSSSGQRAIGQFERGAWQDWCDGRGPRDCWSRVTSRGCVSTNGNWRGVGEAAASTLVVTQTRTPVCVFS